LCNMFVNHKLLKVSKQKREDPWKQVI